MAPQVLGKALGTTRGRTDLTILRPITVVTVILSLITLTACGTRLSREEIVAASRTPGSDGSQGYTAPGGIDAYKLSEGSSQVRGGSNRSGAPVGTSRADGIAAERLPAPGEGGPAQTGGAQTSDDPIVLGHVGTYSGPIGGTLVGGREAILAWASDLNDNGGINGRPVKVVVADDGNDPARNLSVVRDMVERQGVVALVGNMTALTTSASRAYLEDKGVPAIGGDLIDPTWEESPNYFMQGGSFITVVSALPKWGAERGMKRVGVLGCAESTLCDMGIKIVKESAERYGMEVVYEARVSLTAPDYTAECLGAQSRGVELLITGADANTVSRVTTSCARQSYYPQHGAVSLAATPTLPENQATEGLFTAIAVLPWMVTGTTVTDEYHRVMAERAPDTRLGAAASTVWTAAKLFELAASRAAGDITSAGLVEALHTIRDENLGGLTFPLTFVAGSASPQKPCFYYVRIEDGEWTAPDGHTPGCL